MKNTTFTEPTRKAEKIDLQGTDSGGYQNAELEEKPGDNGQVEGTLILKGDEVIEAFIHDAGTAIIQIRNSDTGDVEAQIPSEARLVALAQAQDQAQQVRQVDVEDASFQIAAPANNSGTQAQIQASTGGGEAKSSTPAPA
ncbi:MAG: hypothetical protein IIA49_10290, partial [Bacteroidetes bacterium]|nr:hypothetical protein [Bacteroidota bacterium]